MKRYVLRKEIYNLEAVLKAAYSYTDKYYLHIDADDTYYYVDIEAKNELDIPGEQEFQNEVLAQMVRQYVRKETKNVRELLMARAFSSTVINNTPECAAEESDCEDIKDILTDWFEKYE